MDEVRDLAVTPEEAPRWASFTQDDYLHSVAPLDLLDAEPDLTRRMRLLEDMARDAKSKGFGNFRSLYNLHAKERRKTPSAKPAERRFVEGGNIVEGIDLEREIGCEMKDVLLYCGEWESDTEGVRKLTPRGKIMVCPHPIFPIRRSVDLSDGGCEALKVAFFNHGKWTIVSAPRSTFAVRDSLVRFLSENGAAVTSETGGKLAAYLLEVDARSKLQETAHTSRCGWINRGGGRAFMPFYKDNDIDVVAPDVPNIPDSIHSAGDERKCAKVLFEAWNHSVPVRVVIAASFASVLLEDLGCLPFVVHVWSPESGTGKSVSLMAAASLWANPDLQTGHYIQQFQTTTAALPHIAGFLHDLPLVLDEYQLARGRGADLLYMLTQGREKGKGKRSGGLQNTKSWKSVSITSGESPLTVFSDGADALNRCISLNCSGPLFTDARATANALKANYGHLGRKALQAYISGGNEQVDEVRKAFHHLQTQPVWNGITDKQVDAAAALMTAATLFNQFCFESRAAKLEAKDLLPFLTTQREADRGIAAKECVDAWVAENSAHFWGIHGDATVSPFYGKFEDNDVFIIKTKLDEVLKDEGFSPVAIYSSWASRGEITRRTDGPGFGDKVTIHGTGRVRCIRLKLEYLPGKKETEEWWNRPP